MVSVSGTLQNTGEVTRADFTFGIEKFFRDFHDKIGSVALSWLQIGCRSVLLDRSPSSYKIFLAAGCLEWIRITENIANGADLQTALYISRNGIPVPDTFLDYALLSISTGKISVQTTHSEFQDEFSLASSYSKPDASFHVSDFSFKDSPASSRRSMPSLRSVDCNAVLDQCDAQATSPVDHSRTSSPKSWSSLEDVNMEAILDECDAKVPESNIEMPSRKTSEDGSPPLQEKEDRPIDPSLLHNIGDNIDPGDLMLIADGGMAELKERFGKYWQENREKKEKLRKELSEAMGVDPEEEDRSLLEQVVDMPGTLWEWVTHEEVPRLPAPPARDPVQRVWKMLDPGEIGRAMAEILEPGKVYPFSKEKLPKDSFLESTLSAPPEREEFFPENGVDSVLQREVFAGDTIQGREILRESPSLKGIEALSEDLSLFPEEKDPPFEKSSVSPLPMKAELSGSLRESIEKFKPVWLSLLVQKMKESLLRPGDKIKEFFDGF